MCRQNSSHRLETTINRPLEGPLQTATVTARVSNTARAKIITELILERADPVIFKTFLLE